MDAASALRVGFFRDLERGTFSIVVPHGAERRSDDKGAVHGQERRAQVEEDLATAVATKVPKQAVQQHGDRQTDDAQSRTRVAYDLGTISSTHFRTSFTGRLIMSAPLRTHFKTTITGFKCCITVLLG